MISRGRRGLCQGRAKPAAQRGRRALTQAGPRLRSDYPGHAIWELQNLETETQTLSNLIRVRGLWLNLVRYWLLPNRGRMGHVAAEFLPERL